MAVWLVRAGRAGEREDFALQKGVATIGWEDLGNLSRIKNKNELEDSMRRTYPDAKPKSVIHWVGQVWTFLKSIKTDDLVVLPLKKRSAIAIGKIVSAYEYRPKFPEDAKHTRRVEWIKTNIPRSRFDQDILNSLGAYMTVCRISRNKAEERIQAMIEGKKAKVSPSLREAIQEEAVQRDIEGHSRDIILDHIGKNFRGRELERLVDAVLQAQGYKTERSPAGPDSGVDIIAGKGPMGFDPPKIAVQVKSGDTPVDAKELRQLQGTMKNFNAQQGLLVSLSGFKDSVRREARRLFFDIRLWNDVQLLDAILGNYEKFPDDLRAELPLKRIWTLVPKED